MNVLASFTAVTNGNSLIAAAATAVANASTLDSIPFGRILILVSVILIAIQVRAVLK